MYQQHAQENSTYSKIFRFNFEYVKDNFIVASITHRGVCCAIYILGNIIYNLVVATEAFRGFYQGFSNTKLKKILTNIQCTELHTLCFLKCTKAHQVCMCIGGKGWYSQFSQTECISHQQKEACSNKIAQTSHLSIFSLNRKSYIYL